MLGQLLDTLRDRAVRTAPVAFGLLVKHGLPDEVSDSYALPCSEDGAILADTARVMAGASSDPVHVAGQALIERFERPVLFASSPENRVFPIAHARRYAQALPDGRLIEIEDSYSFTPEDRPEALADALAGFAA